MACHKRAARTRKETIIEVWDSVRPERDLPAYSLWSGGYHDLAHRN